MSVTRRTPLLLLACSAWGAAVAKPVSCGHQGTAITFPDEDPLRDGRRLFPISLLRLALQRAGCGHEVVGLRSYGQRRAEVELAQGRLDVTMVGRRDLPARAGLVVPVPIRRGLLGLRLLLCRADRMRLFEGLNSVAALKRLRLGYGMDWHDRRTLEALGFNIVPVNNYAGLFAMLQAGRTDYLSRGINEVWPEVREIQRRQEPIVVVPGLALRYPLDDYFVVRPGAPDLAALIQRGLQQAMADGSYQQLFDEHFGAALAQAGLMRRRVLEITDYPADELVRQAQQNLLREVRAPRPPQSPSSATVSSRTLRHS